MPMNIWHSPRRFGLSLVAVAALAWFIIGGRPAANAPVVTYRVVIEGSRFVPPALTVNVGDSIVWVNEDPFPHTATSAAGRFDSREIAPQRSWTYRAATRGEFAYICALHPTMQATLRVQ